MPANIERLVVVVNIYKADERNQNFGQVNNAYVRLVDTTGGKNEEQLRFDLTEDYSGSTGIRMADIYRHNGDDDGCLNFSDHDSIAFHVTIGNYKVDINRTSMPYCTKEGDEADFRIYIDNPARVDLSGENVSITFDEAATKAGFKNSDLSIVGDTLLVIHIPSSAKSRTPYGLDLHIGSECPENELNKQLQFTLTFDIPVLTQRYNNVLGLLRDSFPTQELTDFVWFHDGDTVPDQETSVLYLDETNPANEGEYYVCFNVHEQGKPDYTYCTCPISFVTSS